MFLTPVLKMVELGSRILNVLALWKCYPKTVPILRNTWYFRSENLKAKAKEKYKETTSKKQHKWNQP